MSGTGSSKDRERMDDDAPTIDLRSGSAFGDDVTVPGCPNRTQLELFSTASRTGRSSDLSISQHITICPVCREIVRQLQDDNRLVAEYVDANRGRFDGSGSQRHSRAPLIDDPLGSNPLADAGSGAEVVPGFRVEGEIHRGAQGVVYRAEQLSTRRRVALKTLLQGKFATSRQRQRFEREVEVVASLRHPNIVTLYESGRTRDGLMFFAMELVDGGPLSDLLKSETRPSRDRMLSMFLAIVRAIAYAHQRGVIHRDLKPGNILMDENLDPHVLDFGLARTARGDETQEAIETTAAGEFLGTFAYAAPEQLRGDPDLIDVRTDVFALGVILYEILVGHRPWQPQGKVSIADLLMIRLEEAPAPPSQLVSGIDKDLDIIALTCLKSRPEERYQTAAALADDIERFLRREPILARGDSRWYVARKWVARHWLATATATAFVGFLVTALVVLTVAFGRAERQRERAERTLTEFVTTLRLANPETGIGEAGMSFISFLDRLSDELDKRFESHQRKETDPEARLDEFQIYANLLNTIEAIQLDFGTERLSADDRTFRERRLDKALAVATRLAAQMGTADHAEVAEAMHNKARFLFLTRNVRGAEALYREALAMWERIYGVDSAEGAITMRHLGACLRQRAKELPEASEERLAMLATAEDLLRREATIHAKRDEGRNEDHAAAINGLAQIIEERGQQGDDERAFALYVQAAELIRDLTGESSFRTGRATYKIGLFYYARRQYDDAIRHLELAADIIPKARGEVATSAVEARGAYAAALLERGGAIDAAASQAALAAQAATKLVGGDRDRAALVRRLGAAIRGAPADERDAARNAVLEALRSAGAGTLADEIERSLVAPSDATARRP